jgi:trimeric autotransporter adhesin
MREVSVTGIRGPACSRRGARGCLFALLALALLGVNDASAQAITRFVRDTGHINFVTTGGSLRTQDNNGDSCAVGATSTQTLSGIPAGTSIRNAYLYWGGSGGTADTSVTLNGIGVSASRTFATTYTGVTPNLPFFGGFAEVSSIVTGNGSYTFGGLGVVTGSPHCDVSAVVAGWSLIVVYESPTERLRAINLYDGLASFRGSQVVLNPDGFRVPGSNIDGRIAVFTLEGDPANSTTQNGFDEALRFNGNLLDDGIVVPGSNPAVQQFDGTINSQGIATSYGIDVDQYDVSAFLASGQTSATTTYSAGADLVLLMAQIVSATSDPAVDLTVAKSHTGTFVAGGTGTYTITVSNAAGAEREDNTVTVVDTLPAGLTYNSFSGTGWSCSAAAQVVTCTHPATLDPGASFPALNIVVNVLESAAASVTNSVAVSTPSYELVTSNNSATDVTATLDPNLSTSTKTVQDVNGGEASPGDTLRYTITLTESAGGQAVNVSVVDGIPNNTTFAGFVSLPGGVTTAYAPPPAGANGDGQITISGITVPAGSSVSLVFDVTVNAGSAPGSTVDNTAVVTNPNGAENNPAAPQLIVNPSLIPSTGQKFLYLRRDAGGARSLSRVRPSVADTNQALASGGSVTWVIAPALQQALTVPAGNIPVRLWLSRGGGTGARNMTVTLTSSAGGLTATQTQSVNPNNSATAPTMTSFTLNNAALRTIPAGATLTLTVSQVASVNTVTIWPNGNAGSTGGVPHNSRVELNSNTVINVDSVLTYNAAFNGGATQSTFFPGASVFVRAQVSDPFGSFDISGANITIIDPANVTQVSNAAMTPQGAPATCNSQTAASCIFQFQFTVPGIASATSPQLGGWTVRVVANEGVEGTVTDLGVGNFTVVFPQPTITMVKTSTVVSDPLNDTTNPKRIPNAVVRYDITMTNSGPGTVDAGTLVLTDPIPANAAMYVATTSGDPVVFINGTTASGLTYSYPTHVTYSATGAAGPWGYTPVPDASGFDPAVRAVRVAPAGTMSAAGAGNPAFTIQFRVRIN